MITLTRSGYGRTGVPQAEGTGVRTLMLVSAFQRGGRPAELSDPHFESPGREEHLLDGSHFVADQEGRELPRQLLIDQNAHAPSPLHGPHPAPPTACSRETVGNASSNSSRL